MKKTLAHLFIMLSLFITSTAHAVNFVEIIRNDRWLVYVDTDSIERRDDYLVAWTKWIPRGEQAAEARKRFKKTIVHQMSFDAYNTQRRQTQTLHFVIYGENGTIIESDSRPFAPSGYSEIIPGTNGATLYDFIMLNADPTARLESELVSSLDKMSEEEKDTLVEAAISLACRNYLWIDRKDFDSNNQMHLDATRKALLEIHKRAKEIQQREGGQYK